mgnify:CR=1 FL=1
MREKNLSGNTEVHPEVSIEEQLIVELEVHPEQSTEKPPEVSTG